MSLTTKSLTNPLDAVNLNTVLADFYSLFTPFTWDATTGDLDITTTGILSFTSPVLTTPQINDTTSTHQYIYGVSELAADRTVTLPLLTGNDEFVFKDHIQTLTNKTLTTPDINGGTWNGTVDGSFKLTRTATATDYDITASNVYVGVTSTAAARTVRILTAAIVVGAVFIIADESLVAGTNNITISTEGAETIDGSDTAVICEDGGSITLIATSTTTLKII